MAARCWLAAGRGVHTNPATLFVLGTIQEGPPVVIGGPFWSIVWPDPQFDPHANGQPRIGTNAERCQFLIFPASVPQDEQ
jgi:hypothetical protein